MISSTGSAPASPTTKSAAPPAKSSSAGDAKQTAEALAPLLRGETAGAAFDFARSHLAADPAMGPLSVAPGGVPPSDKFRINEAGRSVRLPAVAEGLAAAAPTMDKSKVLSFNDKMGYRRLGKTDLWVIAIEPK